VRGVFAYLYGPGLLKMNVSGNTRDGKPDGKVSDSFGSKGGFRALIIEWYVLVVVHATRRRKDTRAENVLTQGRCASHEGHG